MSGGRRLRAPTTDRTWLVDPPWSELPAVIDRNIALQASILQRVSHPEILRRIFALSRAELLRDALHDTRQYRDVSFSDALGGTSPKIILAGHQPEMFHPGVWAKNFVLAKLAKSVGAVAVNLVIDGDTLKAASLRVPTGTIQEPRVESVPFDVPSDEIPHEERLILDEATFASFADRAAELIRPLVPNPMLPKFWKTVLARHADGIRTIGDCIAQARHQWEGEWGLETLELKQSRLCDSTGFRWLAMEVIQDLPAYHLAQNHSLADYRAREHIRSANHPVPALERIDDWYEAPFWLWSPKNPRRRRVFVRNLGGELELTDRADVAIRFPLDSANDYAKGVESLADLSRQGVKLRSRALLTTTYARVLAGDLFIHGIGGGKYEELNDLINTWHFDYFKPSEFAVVTATRRLPIPLPPHRGKSAAEIEHELWEMEHHPEQFLTGFETEAEPWLEQKRRWTETEHTRENGRERCQAIREANAALRQIIWQEVARAGSRLFAERRRSRAEAVLTSREFSSFLFPEQDLREFLLALPQSLR